MSTITTADALNLHAALLALDGAKDADGNVQPYKLSGRVRYAVARNLAALKEPVEAYERARVGLVKEFASGGNQVPEDRVPDFLTQIATIQQQPVDVALHQFDEPGLYLDDNAIPSSVLVALLPLIEEA